MLSPEILTALQNQLTLERTNAAYYDALSASLEAVNWPGSAAFMKRSANDERTHAQKFSDYIVDRNETPEYSAVEQCPKLEDDDLVLYFQAALQREKLTTEAINGLYELADMRQDPQTCIFLHWFIAEQTASERELTDCLIELRRADNSGRIILDREYGEEK
jgi:ferritin